MYVRDTIAAISTPIGEGGIGVIRISGPDSRQVVENIFRKKNGGWLSHRFYYGRIVVPESGDTLDDVLVVWMKAPNSFTREDVVEIQCHGGFLVVQKILDLVLGCGARIAEPGEFTRRAFLNGRLDLVQAEAVIDVIRSKTDRALALAQRQHEGMLSRKLFHIRELIVHGVALLETFIDFPEEEIDDASLSEVLARIDSAIDQVHRLISGFDEGRVLRDGVSVMIAGKPNVGKSSLLNSLLREKRAIVTSVPGTTRDVIEEVVNIRGLPVRLLDTAGIRHSEDHVERIGIDLALEKIPEADLLLFLLDSSRPFDSEDRVILDRMGETRYIVVINKSDLPSRLQLPVNMNSVSTVNISTLTGEGVDSLRDEIFRCFIHGEAGDSRDLVTISHARHRDALQKCTESLQVFRSRVELGYDLELLAVDLRDALHSLGEVTGETTPDEVLDLIFSRFCIGK